MKLQRYKSKKINFEYFFRDAFIVSILDTFTSLLAGFTIFGILGNLAHSLDTTIENVVKTGGTGLAFISYPDAISKFEWVPQVNNFFLGS